MVCYAYNSLYIEWESWTRNLFWKAVSVKICSQKELTSDSGLISIIVEFIYYDVAYNPGPSA